MRGLGPSLQFHSIYEETKESKKKGLKRITSVSQLSNLVCASSDNEGEGDGGVGVGERKKSKGVKSEGVKKGVESSKTSASIGSDGEEVEDRVEGEGVGEDEEYQTSIGSTDGTFSI